MTAGARIAIVALLAAAAAGTLALRGAKRAEYFAAPTVPAAVATPAPEVAPAAPSAAPAPMPAPPASHPERAANAPRLLELGSMRCQACLEMAKVLDALRASQGPKLQVDFIDVFEEPEAADRHKIALIPTQIFFDAAGKEIFRHQGFFSHDEILAKFRALGVKL